LHGAWWSTSLGGVAATARAFSVIRVSPAGTSPALTPTLGRLSASPAQGVNCTTARCLRRQAEGGWRTPPPQSARTAFLPRQEANAFMPSRQILRARQDVPYLGSRSKRFWPGIRERWERRTKSDGSDCRVGRRETNRPFRFCGPLVQCLPCVRVDQDHDFPAQGSPSARLSREQHPLSISSNHAPSRADSP
jgi:hypothetical protein